MIISAPSFPEIGGSSSKRAVIKQCARDQPMMFTISMPLRVRAPATHGQEAAGMFKFFGRLATVHSGKVCAAWLALGVALALLASPGSMTTYENDICFLPEQCDSVRGYKLLNEA